MTTTVLHDDNLAVLHALVAAGERYDLIELDGPYGAGLEDWDTLTEDQYLAHYAERLSFVAQLLQPWGVVFLFGYPEGCAEIKTWARQTGTLHLRRWLTWYKQRTAHKGRKCEAVLVLTTPALHKWTAFKQHMRAMRIARSLKIVDVCRASGVHANFAHKVGGYLWFENDTANAPTVTQYLALKPVLSLLDEFDAIGTLGEYKNITDRDCLSSTYHEDTRELGDAGLRSKPIGLYLDLFRPVIPPRDTKRALVLYGGSGNAAIAAGQLGYEVTIVEQDAARCELIRRRWAWHVERRDETPETEYGPLFAIEAL